MPHRIRYSLFFTLNNRRPSLVTKTNQNIMGDGSSGLTLIELLVTLLLISFTIIVSASLVSFGVIGLRGSDSNYELQNAVDRNLSLLEGIADRYVCNTSAGCTVASSVPDKRDYVAPNNITLWADFSRRCQQKDYPDINAQQDLISPLVNYINNPANNVPTPTGIYREVTVHGTGSAIGFGRIKHFTVSYRKGDPNGTVLRNSTIIPTVVSYCP
jgi:hypothetical protein